MVLELMNEIACAGYVCVRGFDGLTKAPKPLVGRLHLQAGKAKGASADA
jgi:hypothetical protein